jgi:hypothetical protein
LKRSQEWSLALPDHVLATLLQFPVSVSQASAYKMDRWQSESPIMPASFLLVYRLLHHLIGN